VFYLPAGDFQNGFPGLSLDGKVEAYANHFKHGGAREDLLGSQSSFR
jgi:hypothetical protein